MSDQRILLDIKNNIATLTLNNPTALNSIAYSMTREILSILKDLSKQDSGVRCLLITGTGSGFCSGMDVVSETIDENLTHGEAYYNHWAPLFFQLRDMPIPIISAVNGVAAGVGMSLALSADLVVAAKSAYFLQAFTRIGAVPDGGICYLLPRLIGIQRAMELSLLAEKLYAEKALEWGLIYQVAEDEELMSETMKLAGRLAKGPTCAYGLTRKSYWRSFEISYEDLFKLEADNINAIMKTEDMMEGIMAFAEKRPAKFMGK